MLGDPMPYQPGKLTAEQYKQTQELPRGPAVLSDADLASHFMSEPDAQYLTRFERDWLAKVLRK
jgi:hypothetical protein